MSATILSKTSGNTENISSNIVHITSPSIIRLEIAPEQVRSFAREGQHLKITLLDGRVFVLEQFFDKDENNERSDLVLQDDAGVLWWGQYPEEWTGFHFAEIDEDAAGVIPPWLWAGLGLLGIGGAAAAAGGGGGGGGDGGSSNHPPVADPDQGHGGEGSPITGDVLINDRDPNGNPLKVTSISVDTDGDGTPESYRPGQFIDFPGKGKLLIHPDGKSTANTNSIPNRTGTAKCPRSTTQSTTARVARTLGGSTSPSTRCRIHPWPKTTRAPATRTSPSPVTCWTMTVIPMAIP